MSGVNQVQIERLVADASDPPVTMVPCAKRLRIVNALRSVPNDKKHIAMRDIAYLLLQDLTTPFPHPEYTHPMAIIATFITDDGNVGTPLPQIIRDQVNLVVETYTEVPQQAMQTMQMPFPFMVPNGTFTVETAAEKESKERQIVLHGFKMPATAIRPYDSLYPHLWAPPKQFPEWEASFTALFNVKESLAPVISFKVERYMFLMEQWFIQRGSSEITRTLTIVFNGYIQLLLEAYLAHKYKMHAGVATATFASATRRREHNALVLNYFEDLAEAEKAVTTAAAAAAPKNGVPGQKAPFRR
jgi:hypothetical protein